MNLENKTKKELLQLLLNHHHFYGNTLLHNAVQNSDISMITLLLKLGIDVNIVNVYGDTPLLYAVIYSNLSKNFNTNIIKLLLDKGADVDIKNYYNYTPLDIAKKLKCNKEIIQLLTLR